MSDDLMIFEGNKIRRTWKDDDWFYSIVDIISSLTESKNPRDYWYRLKVRELEHDVQLSTFCRQLKMESPDGKKYLTDCSSKQGIFRIIQSIPSRKAEPFKLWLAKVGSERIDEMDDPELSIDRAMKTYLAKGHSEKWINQRLKTIEVRKEITDEWRVRGVEEGQEFAILTNEITLAWSGKSIREYKQFKNLKRESLRDNMTNLELALNMLAEASTVEISKKIKPNTFDENKKVAKEGGRAAGKAREVVEESIGESVISNKKQNLKLKNTDSEKIKEFISQQ